MPVPTLVLDDFLGTLTSNFPRGWASPEALSPPEFDQNNNLIVSAGDLYATFHAIASNDLSIYQEVLTTQQQLSLLTAVGSQIDNISEDLFGKNLPRHTGESDSSFKGRIVAQLFSPLGTKAGLSAGVQRALNTGAPAISEQNLNQQTGGFWSPGASAGSPLAFGARGCFVEQSSAKYPFTAFITVQQPETTSPNFMTFSQILSLLDLLRPIGVKLYAEVVGPASTGGVPVH